MNPEELERNQQLAARSFQDRNYDLTAKYMAACDLRSICSSHPQRILPETVAVLGELLQNEELAHHTRAWFLYQEAATCLHMLATGRTRQGTDRLALTALIHALSPGGLPGRAAAESLGNMPVSIQGPQIPESPVSDFPALSLDTLLGEAGLNPTGPPKWVGRSLVFHLDDDRKLVFKTAPPRLGPRPLVRETGWLDYLRVHGDLPPLRWDIPRPVWVRGSSVFFLEGGKGVLATGLPSSLPLYAAAFLTHPDYFTYVNNSSRQTPLHDPDAMEAMLRSAFLLGHLCSRGIVHEAPIPLFHNRVQQHRRDDHGRYQWQRAGRLDRWLESCAYPNLGLTGIRDFEHFISFSGTGRTLYTHMGTHFLSLLLVAGSYFRNKDKSRVGLDQSGKPVDARDLFSAPLLRELVEGIFLHYYRGFVGEPFHGDFPFDLANLAGRMIEEMGRDLYMEEVLRVADQEGMSEDQFREFLKSHGFDAAQAAAAGRGTDDIILHTGPHLGGFNQRISLPELIDAAASMSGLCITGRYLRNATELTKPGALFHGSRLRASSIRDTEEVRWVRGTSP